MSPVPPTSGRIAIVLSHPTQYYAPWFRWLRAHTRLEFRVFYLWDFGVNATHDRQFGRTFAWDVNLLDGYEHEFVPNTSPDPGTHHFRGLRNPGVLKRLRKWRPNTILLFGYNYATHVRVIAWARWRGISLLFRGDSHLIGRPAPRGLHRAALTMLYRQFAAITYVGEANRDYFVTLGVPGKKLFFAPHAVDDRLFDPTEPAHRAGAEALRAALGISPATRVVLFAGKLVPAKQPRELLQAFLTAQVPSTSLVFVGEGEEKAALVDLARSAPAGMVHFLPFANQSEMPARYLLADIFALPSRGLYETWGLAVNEAMLMGVPALVSDRVGCQRDLVSPGETGWVFPAEDLGELSTLLAKAFEEVRRDRDAYRARVAARISRYSYGAASKGLLAAIDHARPPASR